MTRSDNPPTGVDPRYAASELVKSLRAAEAHTDPELRARARVRVHAWLRVLEGMRSGALKVGHRSPVPGMPVWLTPAVVRGGFATGDLAAGGPTLPHEEALAGTNDGTTRLRANAACLTPSGLDALGAKLDAGTYRVTVPEESALLAVRALIERGDPKIAADVVEEIAPYFDRVRFHPQPGAAQHVPDASFDAPVLLSSAYDVARSLRRKTPSASVETMREANEIWAPMTDAFVSLVLETISPEPRFEGGRLTQGVVFARSPEGFDERCVGLLAKYTIARASHTRCKRPHRANEVLGTIVGALSVSASERGWWSSRVAHRLAGFVAAYGIPGSPEHTALRASQHVGPSHAAIAQVVADRLEASVGPGEGLEDVESVLEPVRGVDVPHRTRSLVTRATPTPLSALVAARHVRSAEAMAPVLPQLTSLAFATRFDDPRLRTLYVAVYRAFRQRRSLLLLWLQHQVTFRELPWVLALEATSDRSPEPAVRQMLRETAAFALATFPGTQLPNRILTELGALASDAGLGKDEQGRSRFPLTEELAADIFMGTFSAKFLNAAQLAGRLLGEGSLYARYYRLPYERVLRFEASDTKWGVKTSQAFDALCEELAALPTGGNPRARNGAIIEQASILTTHGLATLVSALDLEPLLRERWYELAQRALDASLDRLERRVLPEKLPRITRMRSAKTIAFAWRQMLFFASQLPQPEVDRFVIEARTSVEARSEAARVRFEPVMRGLEIVNGGSTLDGAADAKRLLGWTVGPHFLLGG